MDDIRLLARRSCWRTAEVHRVAEVAASDRAHDGDSHSEGLEGLLLLVDLLQHHHGVDLGGRIHLVVVPAAACRSIAT